MKILDYGPEHAFCGVIMWTVVRKPNGEWYIGGSSNPKDYIKYDKSGIRSRYEVYNVRTSLGKGTAIGIAIDAREGVNDGRVDVYK